MAWHGMAGIALGAALVGLPFSIPCYYVPTLAAAAASLACRPDQGRHHASIIHHP